jgi:hypothetical protein
MFVRRPWDKLIALLAFGGLFVAISVRPQLRLRTDMPTDFVDKAAKATSGAPEVEIAQGYWDCALSVIQREFGAPGQSSLPQDPPSNFRITTADLGPAANGDAVRMRYWRKLRQAWYRNDDWNKSYEWDFGWMSDPVRSLGERLQKFLQQFTQSSTISRTYGHTGGS